MAQPDLRYFAFRHLAPRLQRISAPFAEVATWIATALPDNPQTRRAMERLLEAKDCAVRGCLDLPEGTLVEAFRKPEPATGEGGAAGTFQSTTGTASGASGGAAFEGGSGG